MQAYFQKTIVPTSLVVICVILMGSELYSPKRVNMQGNVTLKCYALMCSTRIYSVAFQENEPKRRIVPPEKIVQRNPSKSNRL